MIQFQQQNIIIIHLKSTVQIIQTDFIQLKLISVDR